MAILQLAEGPDGNPGEVRVGRYLERFEWRDRAWRVARHRVEFDAALSVPLRVPEPQAIQHGKQRFICAVAA
jgi:hypothetical protein